MTTVIIFWPGEIFALSELIAHIIMNLRNARHITIDELEEMCEEGGEDHV